MFHLRPNTKPMPTLCRMRRSKIGRRTSWGWQITLAVIFYNGIREEGERSSKEGEHRPGNLLGDRLGGRALKGSATKKVFKSGHKRADGRLLQVWREEDEVRCNEERRVGWEEKKGVGEDESEEGQVSLHQSRENFPWKMEVPLVGG